MPAGYRAAEPATPPSGAGDHLSTGRQVIALEAAALERLAAALDHHFAAAVDLILAPNRRVVVAGLGKSGHVARKIAATLSSTGSPALFLHPAEAAHGDLGMLVPGDVLLVLTNSGETAEVLSIMRYARSIGCAIVAITGREGSSVARAADIALTLPPAREACPVNIAPTTSTTMMMALGDALAVTVMGQRGISRERIQVLHPGGAIGASLTPVDLLMHRGDRLPLVPADLPMRDAMLVMTEKRLGITGVVDPAGMLVGAITDGDLRRHIDHLMTASAGDVMTPRPRTIPLGTVARDARALMRDARITALFVVAPEAPGTPLGLVHIHDLVLGEGDPPAVTPDWDQP